MTNNTDPNQRLLDQRLRSWRVDAPLPPRFQEQVWQRIEKAGAATATAPALGNLLGQLLEGIFARRAWAATYLALALMAGLGLGLWRVHDRSDSFYAELGRKYVQSIDPYQKSSH